MRRILRLWFPPLAWMALIFIVSAQPSLPSAPRKWDLLLKKAMHALAYGALAWLYLRALRGRSPTTIRICAASWGLALAYALSDEYHQSFVPGRHGALVDVAVDGFGAGGAMLLSWWRGHLRVRSP